MLKKQDINISGRKKSELHNTPGEIVRDNIIKAGIKTVQEAVVQEAANAVANTKTEVMIEIAQKAGGAIDGGTALIGGSESASALGRIAFKTTKNVARGDTICTGLCLISGTCEAVALGCSTIKVIPFQSQIYVGAKIISQGCISFRNACAGEGC